MLRTAVPDVPMLISSAGTRALAGSPMTEDAKALAIAHGADADDVNKHVARTLTEGHLRQADLVLAMAREHRREVVELDPSSVRRTFTLLELSKLLHGLSDSELLNADGAGKPSADPGARFASMLAVISGRRGLSSYAANATADDVIDPYRRTRQTYEQSAQQVAAAIPAVRRLVRLAV